MDLHDRERRGTLLAGAMLVLIGLAVLGIQVSGVDVGWPLWIVIPGVAIFVVAVAVGEPTGSGLAALGGIVTSVGLVLAAQQAAGAYASWAYAWALVAPGGVGAGLFLYGILTARWEIARGGLAALVSGVAIFLVGYLFFEAVMHGCGTTYAQLKRIRGIYLHVSSLAFVHLRRDRLIVQEVGPGHKWGGRPDRLIGPSILAVHAKARIRVNAHEVPTQQGLGQFHGPGRVHCVDLICTPSVWIGGRVIAEIRLVRLQAEPDSRELHLLLGLFGRLPDHADGGNQHPRQQGDDPHHHEDLHHRQS
jgi:hypothetical protein